MSSKDGRLFRGVYLGDSKFQPNDGGRVLSVEAANKDKIEKSGLQPNQECSFTFSSRGGWCIIEISGEIQIQ